MKIAKKKIPRVVQDRLDKIIGYTDAVKACGGIECKKGSVPVYWVANIVSGQLWGIELLSEINWVVDDGRIGHKRTDFVIVDNVGKIHMPIIKSIVLGLEDVTKEYEADF